MKILLIDVNSDFLDFALRCEACEHEVRIYQSKCKDGSRSQVGKGLLNIVPDWQPHMKWADLILTSDNTRYTRELESYRKKGFPIWGCNVPGAAWELERDVGQKVFESAGIACMPSTRFSSFGKAIDHLSANADKRFVCKPIGDLDKSFSYVSKSSQDLMFMLRRWKSTYPGGDFIFQDFCPGIEMAVGGWVGRNGFLSCFLENFEFKKLMNDDVGCNTGEQGTLMKYCSIGESKLAQQMLLPLEAELIRSGYTGYIDVAVIVDEKGQPWPLEFTCRPGWPLFQIQQVLHPDPAEWMLDALNGIDTFEPCKEIAAGVVVAMPDYPYMKQKQSECSGYPVWGITEKNRYWVHPCAMKLGSGPVLEGGTLKEGSMLVTTGPYVMVVSGAGDTVHEAKDHAYAHLKDLEIPNSPMYRTDIGCRLEHQLPELQDYGYALSWEW